uniref:RNase H type-1 domain-containing protein n=1 Tax=Nymphaea colorata TaxID=210225 RepID=A0A5K1A4A4_9MAGN
MYFDGSRNVMGAGIGILLITLKNEMILYSLKFDFPCTHNMAEYEALIQGLRSLLSFQVKRVYAFGDSQLIINQVNGKWQVKDENLVPYQEIAAYLIRQFEEGQLAHIKREGNPIADGHASLGSTITFQTNESISSFEIGRLERLAFETTTHVYHIQEGNTPCYRDIKRYIESGEFPIGMSKNE